MATGTRDRSRRYRRRLVGVGAVVFVLIFAIGALVSVPGSDEEPAVATSTSPQPTAGPVASTAAPSSTAVPDSSTTTAAPDTTVAPSTSDTVSETIGELIRSDPQFSQLASLISDADLDSVVDQPELRTMLAPTDDAFDAAFDLLGADAFEALLSDRERVTALVLHHLRAGGFALEEFEPGPVEMLDGTDIVVDRDGDDVTFESAGVVALPLVPDQVDLFATNGVVHAIDSVLLVARNDVDPGDPTPTAIAVLEDGRIVLSGFVASDADRSRLVAAAEAGRDPSNVIDDLLVDPGAPLEADDIDRLARLVEVMPALLVSGTAALSPDVLVLTGVHLGDGPAQLAIDFGGELGAVVEVEPRPVADASSAAAVSDDLALLVAANPVRFEPNSAELSPSAAALLELVAARVQQLDGVRVAIIGHTDSGGDEVGNLVLSEARAAAVLDVLVAGGVPADVLESSGRGESEPVLDSSGVEDPEASRRVEFVVSAEG